ncbi:MAG: hypothetical protein GX100_02275 [candidate division WS1 bacterium]|nr:hypothetical protein [candidate division WS1 bacterium]
MRMRRGHAGVLCVLAVLSLLPLVTAVAAEQQHRLVARDFRLYYWTGQEATAEAVTQVAETSLPRLREILGLEQSERIDLYLARTGEEFRQLTGGSDPTRVLGVALPQRRIVVLQPMRGAFLRDLVAHELTHVLLMDRVGNLELPRWVHEGVAKYAAGDFNPNDRAILIEAINRGGFIPLERLEAAFEGPPEQVSLAYAEAYTLVEFLAGRHPQEGLAPFLRELQAVGDPSRALLRAYGLTAAEIGQHWQQVVWTEYLGRSNVEQVTPLIWAGMVVLFLVVFLVNLRRRAIIRRRLEAEEEDGMHGMQDARGRYARRRHHRFKD